MFNAWLCAVQISCERCLKLVLCLQVRKEKKRKDYTFRRQFDEKPSIIPGCPGLQVTIFVACFQVCCWCITQVPLDVSLEDTLPTMLPSLLNSGLNLRRCQTDWPCFPFWLTFTASAHA